MRSRIQRSVAVSNEYKGGRSREFFSVSARGLLTAGCHGHSAHQGGCQIATLRMRLSSSSSALRSPLDWPIDRFSGGPRGRAVDGEKRMIVAQPYLRRAQCRRSGPCPSPALSDTPRNRLRTASSHRASTFWRISSASLSGDTARASRYPTVDGTPGISESSIRTGSIRPVCPLRCPAKACCRS